MQNVLVEANSDAGAQSLPRLAYSMEETARMLGVSYITVHRLVKRGKLRALGALRHKLIPAAEIKRFLEVTNSQ